MVFDFDLKFSFLPNPDQDYKGQKSTPTFIFEKGENKTTYYLQSMSELQ